MKYSIAIVDDEREQQDVLKENINRYFAQNGGAANIRTFEDGKQFLNNYKAEFDLVFMDIEMPDVNGMAAAKKLRETDDTTAIIFVTRMARYALKGYDVGALDFIVKPVDYYSFALKFKRALSYAEKKRKSKITLRQEDAIVCLDCAEITYVETVSHNLLYHTAGGGAYKVWGSLKSAAQALQSCGDFALCNRCYLVNLAHVDGVSGNVAKVGGDELIISRYKRKEFIESLAGFLGR